MSEKEKEIARKIEKILEDNSPEFQEARKRGFAAGFNLLRKRHLPQQDERDRKAVEEDL